MSTPVDEACIEDACGHGLSLPFEARLEIEMFMRAKQVGTMAARPTFEFEFRLRDEVRVDGATKVDTGRSVSGRRVKVVDIAQTSHDGS